MPVLLILHTGVVSYETGDKMQVSLSSGSGARRLAEARCHANVQLLLVQVLSLCNMLAVLAVLSPLGLAECRNPLMQGWCCRNSQSLIALWCS